MPKENKRNFKSIIPVLVPLLIAAIVVSAFAISGKITKTNDNNTPSPQTSPSIAESTTESVPQDAKVDIVAVGDNLIHNTLIAAGEQEDGTLNYDSFYEDISPYIKAADMAVINQETMLGGSSFDYTGYPVFNSPWEIGDAAINAGFDVFTCATNHSMDVGSAGIEKELEFFSKYPDIIHIGTNASEEDYNKITYTTVNDIKFALLNYTYGTNGIAIPEDKPYIINMLEESKVRADIEEARKNAEVVIVFPHWGTENSHEINDQQRQYVDMFSELGVDIVIGCHPHVLQDVEWVTNEKTGKRMLVYYSLGNFISHQINLNQLIGGMAEITIERKAGNIEITNAKLAPVIDFYTRSGNGFSFSVYKLSDYTDEIAAKQAQKGTTVEYFTQLSKEVISEEFLDLN